MAGLLNTYSNLTAAVAKGRAGKNLTDVEIANALAEIGAFLGVPGLGQSTTGLVLDTAAAPTDIIVQAAFGGIEVYDGQVVYVRNSTNNAQLKGWKRVAGDWLAIVAAP